MKNIFFIGDTHFGHKNVINLSKRPFNSIEEMDEKLINNWNSVVKKDYKVFMTGDFALTGKDKIIEYGNRLNGRKTLILGNHDGASMRTYREAGFEFISKYPVIFNNIIVTHIPFHGVDRGDFKHIFAHLHGNFPKDKFPHYSEGFCTSVEEINYTPISYDEILQRTGW